VQRFIEDHQIKRIVTVPGRLVNVVTQALSGND